MSRSVIVSKQLNALELLKHIIFIILQTMTSPMSTIFLDLDKIELKPWLIQKKQLSFQSITNTTKPKTTQRNRNNEQ